MIKAIIIDDDFAQRQVIKGLIKNRYSNITVEAESEKVDGSKKLIEKIQPDLVFLDIELSDGDSFEILRDFERIDFKIIFITGFKDYAIEAFKYSAMDYLLKPVKSTDFYFAVNKTLKEITIDNQYFMIKNMVDNLHENQKENRKIVLKTQEEIFLVKIDDIVRCESENSYVTFYLSDNRKIIVTSTLTFYEELLEKHNFYRIHQSHLINLKKVESYSKKDGGFVILSDHSKIAVSQRKKNQFIDLLTSLGI